MPAPAPHGHWSELLLSRWRHPPRALLLHEPQRMCESTRRNSTAQQLAIVVVDASYSKVWFTVKWVAHIMEAMRLALRELDDRQNEVVGLVERVENLVLRHGDRRCA